MTAAATSTRAASILTARASGRRTFVDRFMRGLAMIAAISCIIPLAAVLAYVTLKGIAALNIDPPHETAARPGHRRRGPAGHPRDASDGAPGCRHGDPVRGPRGRVHPRIRVGPGRPWIRFAADVLVGIPSILIGIFVYTFLVLPFKQYNAFAGIVALAIIMIPVIMRTTEEILKLGPGVTARSVAGPGCPSLADHALGGGAGPRCPAYSPGSCWPSPGRPARRRHCCSPLLAAGWSTSGTSANPWTPYRCSSIPMPASRSRSRTNRLGAPRSFC